MSKRGAGVQLTKDDYERQDDEDRYGPPIIEGTWQKADADVLKNRVIRKAKRPTPSGGPSLPLPPENPFANVQLAPTPAVASANPFANVQLVPTKAQKTDAQSSAPLTFNPFASIQLPAPAAAAPALGDPGQALRARMQAVRQARMHML